MLKQVQWLSGDWMLCVRANPHHHAHFSLEVWNILIITEGFNCIFYSRDNDTLGETVTPGSLLTSGMKIMENCMSRVLSFMT